MCATHYKKPHHERTYNHTIYRSRYFCNISAKNVEVLQHNGILFRCTLGAQEALKHFVEYHCNISSETINLMLLFKQDYSLLIQSNINWKLTHILKTLATAKCSILLTFVRKQSLRKKNVYIIYYFNSMRWKYIYVWSYSHGIKNKQTNKINDPLTILWNTNEWGIFFLS